MKNKLKVIPNKTLWVAVLTLAFVMLALIWALLLNQEKGSTPSSINNFEECKNAGYPIQEKYPEVCAVPGGQNFTNPNQTVIVN